MLYQIFTEIYNRMQTSEKFQDNNRFDNNVNNKFAWNSRENFS